MRPPILKGQDNATQRVNPFSLNQAILIGLSPSIPKLEQTIHQMQRCLAEPVGIFPDYEIHRLTDLHTSGNRTILLHRLNALAEGSQVDAFENVMLYFVGHAEKIPSYRLLLPERIMSEDSKPEPRDWLDWTTLQEWIAPIRVKNLLIVLDTCHAKAIHTRQSFQWLQQLDARDPGQKVLIAAGSDDPQSWEREWSCFFTQGFVEGLKGWTARNDRGAVDVDGLFRYLYQRVPEIARERASQSLKRPHPIRMNWPERPPFPMELTLEQERFALDKPLQQAILEGRCLLWVGESLKARTTPSAFPPRQEWEPSQRDLWLDYIDSQRAPGVGGMQVATFGLTLLDSGVDTALLKACSKRDFQTWIPTPGSKPPPPGQQMLIRLSGEPNSEHFAYEWEDLERRFEVFCEWLTTSRQFDTLFLVGLPLEELTVRNWIKVLSQIVPQVWLAFPHSKDHDRAWWLNDLGVKLIYAQDHEVLKMIKETTKGRVTQERTALVRPQFPKKQLRRGRDIASTPNPYRGLMPFLEMHYDIFYGRLTANGEGPLQALRDDILHNQKVLLYGESGSGKTSLIRAGLLPVLEQVDGYQVFFSDADDPLADLAQKAKDEPCFATPPTAENVLERLGYLSRQRGGPVLICLDHMERAFLQKPLVRQPQKQATGFLEELEAAMRKLEEAWPTGRWRVLFSVRKDAYIHLRDFIKRREHNRAKAVKHRELFPLDEAAAREAITAPVPEPFMLEEALVERLLIDLRDWRPGQPPSYKPYFLQVVCRQLFERAREVGRKKNGKPLMDLSLYRSIEGGFAEWVRTWILDETIGALSRPARAAAQDILSMLLTEEGARRHRAWAELSAQLSQHHQEAQLLEAKEALLNQQIIRERPIIQGPPHLELTHDVLIEVIRPLRDRDLSLASQVIGHMELHQGKAPTLPQALVRKMSERHGYVDSIPQEQRREVSRLLKDSIRAHKNRRLLRGGLALLVFVIALVGWLVMPRSLDSQIQERIEVLLKDQSPKQDAAARALAYLKSDRAIGVARRKLTQLLLKERGDNACRLLYALSALSNGRVDETVRMASGSQSLLIKGLRCSTRTKFHRIELRKAKLPGAVLTGIDLRGAQLQGGQLAKINLKGATLFGVNLREADLSRANLKDANLESANLKGTNFTGADLRRARLQQATLTKTNFTGALLSAGQVQVLGEAGYPLTGSVCLSIRPSAGFVKGTAMGCYEWHLNPGPVAARPAACPGVLKGPIVAFPSLAKDGLCPTEVQSMIDRLAAYCPPDNKAACTLGKACQSGQAKSCAKLAKSYLKGGSLGHKPSFAAMLLGRACIGDHMPSCSTLAGMLLEGRGVSKQPARAKVLYQKVCAKGDAKSCYQLARICAARQDQRCAQKHYQTACEANIPEACFYRGEGLRIGYLRKANKRAARNAYKRACEADHPEACYQLGMVLRELRQRRASRRTLRKAAGLLKAACQTRDKHACALLGVIYEKGRGLRRSKRKALRYYRRACLAKEPLGCNGLGSLYYYGRGVRKSHRRALRYYRAACQRDHGQACVNAGAMYENGKGTRRDYKSARTYYRRSCELYHGWGCNDLAEMYYTGRGAPRDRIRAKQLYKRACHLGVKDACR